MLRSMLARLGARFGSVTVTPDDGEVDGGGDEEPKGSLRSRLDASVLFAHGTGGEAERELADVEEQARTLEEYRRDG